MDAGAQASPKSTGFGPPDPIDLVQLRELLLKHFDKEELKTLTSDLGVDYDSLRGEGKAGKARELVAYLDRHNGLDKLREVGPRLRPEVPWENVLGLPEQDPSAPPKVPPERSKEGMNVQIQVENGGQVGDVFNIKKVESLTIDKRTTR